MKKVKIGELLNAEQALEMVIDGQNDIDAVTKFKFLQVKRKLEDYAQDYETVRTDCIRKYGTQQENGDYILRAPIKEDYITKAVEEGAEEFFDADRFEEDTKKFEDNLKNFNDALNEVGNKEVEIDEKELFRPDDLFNKGIPSRVIEGLMPVITL